MALFFIKSHQHRDLWWLLKWLVILIAMFLFSDTIKSYLIYVSLSIITNLLYNYKFRTITLNFQSVNVYLIAIHRKVKSMNSGYSSTPLVNKLSLKEGYNCYLFNAPKYYTDWFETLDLNLKIYKELKDKSADFIHAFCTTQKELEYIVKEFIPLLKFEGMLWISWPKGTSKIKTELKREPIREFLLANGLVDIKVAAIDDDWSGLKFVYRLKDRNN